MKRGFSTLEVLIASILVGLAISALLAANMSFTQVNAAGAELSTAEFLVEQIREMTEMTDYAHLPNLDDVVYSPPVDADGNELTHFSNYAQNVTVRNVHPNNLQQVVADGSSEFIRVTVEVSFNSDVVASTSWIRAQY